MSETLEEESNQTKLPPLEEILQTEPVRPTGVPAETQRLLGRVAIVTGGDQGLGRAIAVAFAQEGAGVTVVYQSGHEDAQTTAGLIRTAGGEPLLLAGDVGSETFCSEIVKQTVDRFGAIHIIVNNAAEPLSQWSVEDLNEERLGQTFRTNVYAQVYLIKHALKHLHAGASIINTASVAAYLGSHLFLDHAASKGAVVSLTRSLSRALVSRGIRVNGVAPGPIWTPQARTPGTDEPTTALDVPVPMGRAGEPAEIASCYVFLASPDASYLTGQILHPNGGEIVNG